MKKNIILICGLLMALFFSACEPFIVPEATFVYFNANGGSGDMKAQRFDEGYSQLLNANAFSRYGYFFVGWNTRSDGMGRGYKDEAYVSIHKSVTLYAQWRKPNGTHNGYDWVDLGLPSGLKWATCNVGATTVTGYGDYFAWGEVSPKSDCTWMNYVFRIVGSTNDDVKLDKYNTDSERGWVDDKTTLELIDDAARVNWGGKWRMPTEDECDELIDNCTWKWISRNGVYGYEMKSKINSQSIFIPASGVCGYGTYKNRGTDANFWTSSLVSSDPIGATIFYGDQESFYYMDYYGYRQWGRPVRAVYAEDESYSTIYTVTFKANGGSGTMPSQALEAGKYQYLRPNTFTRSGYYFAGWNTSSSGYGVSYDDEEYIKLTQDITLYAQWKSSSSTSHAYVDLGLPSGIKWATCNVGASSPEEYGDYFAWGETSPKTNYSVSAYKYFNGSESAITKYNKNSSYGVVDNKTTLDLSDDAARANWGGTWRMPTKAEQDELRNNCTWTWTTQNGVSGYKVTSKTNGKSIFLPASGYYNGTTRSGLGSSGHYWSSSLYTSSLCSEWAYYLLFGSTNVDYDYWQRYRGRSVRAVCP